MSNRVGALKQLGFKKIEFSSALKLAFSCAKSNERGLRHTCGNISIERKIRILCPGLYAATKAAVLPAH